MAGGVEGRVGRAAPPNPGMRSFKGAASGLKIFITFACFWYLSTQLDFTEIAKLATLLDVKWVVVATLLLLPQILLVGLRWRWIIQELDARRQRCPYGPIIAISAIAIFFQQVLPTLAAEGIRVVLLVRRGWNWQTGITSVLIDRGVGVLALLAVSFTALLFPSALTALGGNRASVLTMLGFTLSLALIGLLTTPFWSPLLQGWRVTRLVANLATAAHRVLLRSKAGVAILAAALAIHALTILSVWSLGHAEGLALPIVDAAVLCAVMSGVTLFPVSVGGWGLREVAVTTLLQNYGISLEKVLLLSMSFGLIMIVASLPGAIVWALYSPASTHRR